MFCNPLRQIHGVLQHLIVRHHLRHQPKCHGVRRRICFRQHGHLHGFVEPHGTRKQPRAAFIRQQAEPARRIAQLCALRGNPEITGEGQRQPTGNRRTVDGGDHRLVHMVQRLNDPVHPVTHFARMGQLLLHHVRMRRIRTRYIASGTKAAPRTGNDQRPQTVVFQIGIQFGAQLLAHLRRIGVHLFGPVEPDHAHMRMSCFNNQSLMILGIRYGHGVAFRGRVRRNCAKHNPKLAGALHPGNQIREAAMGKAEDLVADELEDILFEQQGSVAVITLNRPDKLNAWTAAMERSIRTAMGACARDDSVRAIVVTGAGRGFCAGADMNLLQSIDPKAGEKRELAQAAGDATLDWDTSLGPDISGNMGGRFGYLPQIPKPIIAAVNGPCAGLGMVFALWCDIRIGAENMFFTTSFAKRGLIAEHGISWLLPELAGHSVAMDLLFSARKVEASEAKSVGLLNTVVASQDLVGHAVAYGRDMSETVSPRSVAVMKAQVWKAKFQSLTDAIDTGDFEMTKSFASEDFKEGVDHFVQKRAPNFTGR